jgi:murein tripeptide amidase MpaA
MELTTAREIIHAYAPDRYRTYAEMTDLLHAFAVCYPDLCQVRSIGQSYEGRDIWAVELGTRPLSDKPGYYIDGNLHASEVTGAEAAVYTIGHLLRGYGADPDASRLLNELAFYIVPRICPDGAEACLTGGVGPYNLRSSVRLWPEAQEMPGLHACDIDGDGQTLLMRWQAEDGEWKVSDQDPRLMIPREPHERSGQFYKLTWEGQIHEYNGVEIKAAPNKWGLDLNRNWPANWEPHVRQAGAGPYPLSEPETRAVADYVLSLTNLFGVQSFHTTTGVILRPSSQQTDSLMNPHDLAAFKAIGAIGERLTGYPCVSSFDGFTKGKPIKGGFVDWCYEHLGLMVYLTELWDALARSGSERVTLKASMEEAGLNLLRWNDRELTGEGFSNWRPHLHPQLGPVEIGGWKTMFTLKNPPAHLLHQEVHKSMQFTLAHADAAPRLAITDLQTIQLEPGLYRVRAVIRNTGYLPTFVTEQAKQMGQAKPVVAELEAEDPATVLDGARREVGHLQGWVNLGYYVFAAPDPFAKERKVEWHVRAEAGTQLTVKARSRKAGTVICEIAL